MNSRARSIAIGGCYCILHLGSDLLTRGLEAGPLVPIRHTPGLALAVLVLGGLAYAPVVLGCFLISAIFFRHIDAPLLLRISTACIQTAVYIAAAYLIRARLGRSPALRNRSDTIYVVCVALAAAAMASVGVTALLFGMGYLPAGQLWASLFFRCAVHTASILMVGPAIAVFAAPRLGLAEPLPHPTQPRSGWETAAQVTALLASLALVYFLPGSQQYHLSIVCFAPLTWIALTRGLPGASLAVLAINLSGYAILEEMHASPAMVGDFLIFSLACGAVALGLGTIVTLRDGDRARLADNEQRLSQVLASARLGFWDCDLAHGTVTYDRTWTEMLGYSFDEAPKELNWWSTLVHPDDLPRVSAVLQRHLAGESAFYEADYRMRTRAGGWKWIHARGSVVARGSDGKALRLAGTHLDLTERREAESEHNRLLHIIEASPDFIASADFNQQVVQLNPAFRQLLGIGPSDSPGAFSLAQLHPGWAADKVTQEGIPHALRHGQWLGETALRDHQGREVPVSQLIIVQRDDEGRPGLISTIARDISRLREIEATRLSTERKMQQAQKLESLGVLAGGIAHDFNNLLTVMLGNASLAQLDLPPGSPLNHYMEQITVSALRAAELCKQMLAYSGKAQFLPIKSDLSSLIEEMSQLLQVSVSKQCTLKLELARDLPAVNVDPIQVRQIIMNLVTNASDAIGERSGTIRLVTGAAAVTAAELAEISPPPDVPPGHYVYLEVSDDGSGMTADVKARIFEPFFTTKFAGRGLGLAAVLGIVRGHHGALKVQSEPDRGSRFRLLLPAAVRSAAAFTSGALSPDSGSQGRILVVDDEDTVRMVAARILESQGYATVQANDGNRAVELFRAEPERFQAVLLDLTMPNLNGEQTFRALRQIRADVPIVLMSGFSEEDTMERFAGCELASFLPKPFDREGLIRTVRAAAAPAAARA